ncbi:ComEA family DNA-binding protein, partial [Bacteroidota bacterium]
MKNKIESDLYDLIEQLLESPLDINNAVLSDLKKIPLLDHKVAESIIEYRKKKGKIFSTSELYEIENLSDELVTIIKPFFHVEIDDPDKIFDEKPVQRKYKLYFRTRSSIDIQQKIGIKSGKYTGSNLKNYNRLLINYRNNIKIGGLIEKDNGEQKYTDFYSFHFAGEDLLFFDKIIIGDYSVESGHGLVLWSPYSYSKSGYSPDNTIKSNRNLVNYRSSEENNFFRGAAFRISYSNFSLTPFYSNHKMDANINESTGKIISLPSSGLHRTSGEIDNKDRVTERVIGSRLDWRPYNFLNFEFLYANYRFNKNFESTNSYSLKENEINSYSFAYNA